MPRKRKCETDAYNEAFPTRLREMMGRTKTTQETLGEVLQVSRQMISQYCSGASTPDWKAIAAMAKHFDVSADYLLGLTDVQSPKADLRAVCDYTRLSERAINAIQRSTDEDISVLSALLSDAEIFYSFICIWHARLSSRSIDPLISEFENASVQGDDELTRHLAVRISAAWDAIRCNYYDAVEAMQDVIKYACQYAETKEKVEESVDAYYAALRDELPPDFFEKKE